MNRFCQTVSVSQEDSHRCFRQSVCQLHSCRHSHQSRSLLVCSHFCRTPFTQRCHCQCRSSIFRYACVSAQTVEQALSVRDHSDGHVHLKTLPPITTSHNIARVFCQVKSISTCTGFGRKSRQDGSFRSFPLPGHERYWNGFGFLQIVLSHHTHTNAPC